MNREGFIKLINENLNDYEFNLSLLRENNINFALIPWIHEDVREYFEQGSDTFIIVVELEDGVYYFGANDICVNTSFNGKDIDDITLETDDVSDILVRTSKEELTSRIKNAISSIFSEINKL